ncbi:silencing suppressor protein [Maize white line mosaic virus]|uniref:Silencing suppressor protein n=1 Tax=Maize white line mosaic virus TaxID=445227 RepID=A5YVA8_9TOMB|nr:unnamed protein product [Maize white line mosaic virus]ABQ65753.1 silencing suppressor protein [Maize white line mosaic virus]
MASPEGWVLHPNRCDLCGYATYLRESWRYGDCQTHRRIRHEPIPSAVRDQGVQPWPWDGTGGVSIAVLPANRGISYTLRGHGVTITVSGRTDNVLNITRVANDVFSHPVIQGSICVRGCAPTSVGCGPEFLNENQKEV